MGGWVGGQAEYVMVPYADFNLLKFPDKDKAMAKITRSHAAVRYLPDRLSRRRDGGRRTRLGGVRGRRRTGGTGLRGRVPLAGRRRGDRGRHDPGAAGAGQELRLRDDRSEERRVAGRADRADRRRAGGGFAVDCVGFEARGHGQDAAKEQPATVLNSIMEITRAGGALGIPGLYVTDDPGGVDANAKIGNLGIRIGLGWAKSHTFSTGQCPVMKYNRQLMMAILHDKIQIAKAVNVTVISLDEAPQGYQDFDKGAAKKFVIDPHNTTKQAA